MLFSLLTKEINLNFNWLSIVTFGLIFLGFLSILFPVNVQAAELPDDSSTAQVLKVEARGKPGEYNFAVTISSPDTGCEQYANWWEVISEDGQLLYRRILAHSHVDEQPFTRSGGSIPLQSDQIAIVRVHMHPFGYSNLGQKGTITEGFEATTLDSEFALELAQQEPLPTSCAF